MIASGFRYSSPYISGTRVRDFAVRELSRNGGEFDARWHAWSREGVVQPIGVVCSPALLLRRLHTRVDRPLPGAWWIIVTGSVVATESGTSVATTVQQNS